MASGGGKPDPTMVSFVSAAKGYRQTPASLLLSARRKARATFSQAHSNEDSATDISYALTTLLDLFLDRAPMPYPGTSILGSDRTVDSLYCRD